MSLQKEPNLITGEEVAARRQKLLKQGFGYDSLQMQALWNEVDERDDYLWARYAEPLIATHPGRWAAVSTDGQVLVGYSSPDVHQEARERFGPGSFAFGRLAEFRGFDLL